MAKSLQEIVTRECQLAGLPVPTVVGRAGPGDRRAGHASRVYEVGTIKDVVLDGGLVRRYVSVDGGMSDNIRTALYDADYTVALASRAVRRAAVLCRVVGKHCESGDIVVRDCYLPADLAVGDLIAVAATGAYCYAMSSNYNRVPRPAVVAVPDGDAQAAAAPRDRRRPDAAGDVVSTAASRTTEPPSPGPADRPSGTPSLVPGRRAARSWPPC